jgi:quaternary ammonium compound-resistance protein SugE
MAWVLLAVAGLFEVVWAYFMKVSDGFSKLIPSVLTLIFMIASFAYTVWTGIGAVGSFAVGIFFLGEPASAMRMLAAVLIISGLVLMKLSSS